MFLYSKPWQPSIWLQIRKHGAGSSCHSTVKLYIASKVFMVRPQVMSQPLGMLFVYWPHLSVGRSACEPLRLDSMPTNLLATSAEPLCNIDHEQTEDHSTHHWKMQDCMQVGKSRCATSDWQMSF